MSEKDVVGTRSEQRSTVPGSNQALEGVDHLVKDTVAELSRMLDTSQVVGEPVKVGNCTIIPLVSLGFGFGAGGGGGLSEKGEQGGGGGGGGGGGVKPVGVIIVDDQGVRLARIPDKASGLERLGDAIVHVVDKRRRGDGDEDED
jgi:uncharacterized spore protein YtfJ